MLTIIKRIDCIKYSSRKSQYLLLPVLGIKQREKDEKVKHKRRLDERTRRKQTHVDLNSKEAGNEDVGGNVS